MKYGIQLQAWGTCADIHILVELAQAAEVAGWDGFFLSDHLTTPWNLPVADPWVALTAIGLATTRMRFGPQVTPLPRYRPWVIARAAATLDRLSNGRFVFGAGSGALPQEFDYFGDETNPRVRAAMLDEGLEILAGLWQGSPFHYRGQHYSVTDATFIPTPVQSPRIPIWIAGTWPHRAPFRRAARWDGVYPISASSRSWADIIPLDEVYALVAYTAEHRHQPGPFDVVVVGHTSGQHTADDQRMVTVYEQAGATWWIEYITPARFGNQWNDPAPLAAMKERIKAGPL